MEENWKKLIPWYMTVLSTITLICLAIFLVNNIEWFKTQAISSEAWRSDYFQIHIHHIHISMIKRSVGLFSGFAVLFIGMAVCFYTLKQQTNMDFTGGGVTLAVATNSPGIIAMLIGCYLIVSSIASKDNFESYLTDLTSQEQSKALNEEIDNVGELFNEN